MVRNKVFPLIYCLIILKVYNTVNGISDYEDAIKEYEDAIKEKEDTSPPGASEEEKGIYAEYGEIHLPNNYDKFRIPSPKRCKKKDSAVDVSVKLRILSIGNIDELKEQIKVEMNILLQWIDYEILEQNCTYMCPDYPTSIFTLTPEFATKIWLPDIYIDNVVDVRSQNIINKPTRLLISSNGILLYSTRATVTLNCPLNFLFYPADTQICNVMLSSYAYRSYQLSLSWMEEPHYGLQFDGGSSTDFIRVVSNPQEVKRGHKSYGQTVTHHERFDMLKFQIKLGRRIAHHLSSVYVPTMLYVTIVWVSYLVPSSYRISIAMTILLTLTSMFAVVNQNIPAAGYIKAIDIWMFAAIFYVFFTLVVFAILLWNEVTQDTTFVNELPVTVLERYRQLTDSNESNPKQDENISYNPIASHQIEFSNQRSLLHLKQKFERKTMKCAVLAAKFIETNSFIIHLAIFTLFNVIYWSWLLIGAGYYKWTVDIWGKYIE